MDNEQGARDEGRGSLEFSNDDDNGGSGGVWAREETDDDVIHNLSQHVLQKL